MSWLIENKGWLLGSGGIAGIATIVVGVWKYFRKKEPNITINNNNNVNVGKNDGERVDKSQYTKETIQVLFIDDEKFKIVDYLKKETGYINTKRVKDITNLDSMDVRNANVIFVDINGVGKTLFPQDEGLGLAEALKNRYKDKYIVIYSAQEQGNRFHKAFNAVDFQLSKNADPFEFVNLLDNYCNENTN